MKRVKASFTTGHSIEAMRAILAVGSQQGEEREEMPYGQPAHIPMAESTRQACMTHQPGASGS